MSKNTLPLSVKRLCASFVPKSKGVRRSYTLAFLPSFEEENHYPSAESLMTDKFLNEVFFETLVRSTISREFAQLI